MAGRDARELFVEIIGDDRQLSRTFKNATNESQKFGRNMQQTFRGTIAGSGAFKSLGRQVAFASSTFLGAAGLTALITQSVDAASNLAEQQNKVNVVFGESGRLITEWAKSTATSIGIANDQALEAVGTFGGLFRTVGIASDKNAELSKSLVQLAADMASFNNADPSETLDALRSGLIGEAEPLRRFQVLLSETRVQQEAMRETGKKNAKQLTDQEKILARYALIMKDTALAQGDFSRTQDGLANANRQLHAEIRDTEAVIGAALLPTVRQITIALRDWFGDTQNQAKIQRTLNTTIKDFGEFLQAVEPFGRAFIDVLTGITKATIAMNNAFDKIPAHSVSLQDLFNKIPFHSVSGMDIFNALTGRGGGGVAPSSKAGQDVADRVPGRAPGGAGTFATITGAGGAGGRAGAGRLSLQGQMNRLEMRLAQALTTVSQADDRAILVLEKHLIGRLLANTKDWQKRRQLYQDLAQVQDQIKAIDDEKAQAAKDAAEKEKEAKQKERDAEKKRLEAHREHIRAMRAAWQEQLAKIREATDQVRSEIGELPFQAQGPEKGILGVRGQGAGGFAQAYAAQTRTFVRFYNSLSRLSRMGAPAGLVEQLRGLGVEGAGLVQGLVSHPGQLRSLIRSFRQREQAVMQIAKADINARHVTINLAGGRVGTTAATQRRGRQAGVPSSIGSYIGG